MNEEQVNTVYEKNKININLLTTEKFKEFVQDIISKKQYEEKWQGYFRAAYNALVIAAGNTKNKKPDSVK